MAGGASAATEETLDEATRIAYLRERGVEISLPEERAAEAAKLAAEAAEGTSKGEGRRKFEYVFVPADGGRQVEKRTAEASQSDVLPTLLSPHFASTAAMDSETVARESALNMKNMLVSGNAAGELKAPSAEEMQRQAEGGVAEAYPLAQYASGGCGTAVRLYIDAVGAMRGRPRNKRAEDLAEAAGLSGLSIHGDAYVGRCTRAPGGPELNQDFPLADLSPSSPWVLEARATHMRAAAEAGHRSDEHLASGGDGEGYSWTQTEDDVEVRITTGAPEGRGAAKRVAVAYGRGDKLTVKVDGAVVFEVAKLFARVTPDDCNWTLDQGAIVVTLAKNEPKPWTELRLPGSK